MTVKMKPLFPKKENGRTFAVQKKEKPSVDQQIMETGVRLRGLQRKYRIIIDRELRALRGSRARKQDNPKAVNNLKNAYYCLTIVNKAQERLREITTLQELSKAMNEMGSVLKLMNVVSGKTEKVKTRALQKGIRGLEKATGKDEGGMSNFFQQPLDTLVGDDIIESLLNGKSLEACMDEQEGIQVDPEDAVPLSTEYLQEIGELEEMPEDQDPEQIIADMEEMMRYM